MKKNLMTMLIIAAMTTGLLASCSSTSTTTSTDTTADTTTTTTTETTDDATDEEEPYVYKIALECQSAPFCWVQEDDSNGGVALADSTSYTAGFDVSMISAIMDAAGLEWEAYKIDWDGMLLGVQTGVYDAAISGISITEERKATMLFSDAYYEAGIVLLTRSDSAYADATTLSDFAGATSTSMMNTIWYDMCDQIPDSTKNPAIDNVAAMIVAVESGAVDVVACDEPTAVSAMVSNPDLIMIKPDESDTFVVSPEDVELGIAISFGNEELVEKINEALATITDEDTLAMLEAAVQNQPLSQ